MKSRKRNETSRVRVSRKGGAEGRPKGWKPFGARGLVGLLVSLLAFSPGSFQVVLAQDAPAPARPAEVQILRQLATAGYLGDKKDFYLTTPTLSEDDVTDALLQMDDALLKVDPKSLASSPAYQLGDLQALLRLAQEKADAIRDRKVSAWKFETHLKKMIAALAPPGTPSPEAAATVAPAPKPTPIPGPTQAEFNDLKAAVGDLSRKTGDLQGVYDKKVADLQASNDGLKASNNDLREQLRLVKNLLDRVQQDLKDTGSRLDDVAQKATQKSINDTQLQQELEIMHKDVRDNTQDVGILKEQVAKLDKSNSDAGQSPLDQVLTSKYLAGGALLVGLAALVVSFTRK